jgi:apoptosis-inducing factor 2
MAANKQVVVIGGGFGGLQVAKTLDPHLDVTLVERRETAFHNPGALRAAVDTRWLPRLFIPYRHLLRRGRVVQDRATGVLPNAVQLASGATLPFDYLVLATGSSYPFPAKMVADDVQGAQQAVQQVNARIQQAQRILLIGAGPVGIEFAAEIRERYPEKPITLLESGTRLLPALNPQMDHRLQAGLRERNIELILGDSPTQLPASTTNALDAAALSLHPFVTQQGRTLQADLYFVCFGLQIVSDYLQPTLAASLDARGQVKVNEFLQVEGHPQIFAVGDLTNTGEPKLAITAGNHATAVAENIQLLMQGAALKPYKRMEKSMMIVPLGKKGGAAQLPFGKNGLVLGAWFASQIKGKDLLVSRYWNVLGVPKDQHP